MTTPKKEPATRLQVIVLRLHQEGKVENVIRKATGLSWQMIRRIIARGEVEVPKEELPYAQFGEHNPIGVCERCHQEVELPCLACYLDLGHRCDCDGCSFRKIRTRPRRNPTDAVVTIRTVSTRGIPSRLMSSAMPLQNDSIG
jgi:hypothetical protein